MTAELDPKKRFSSRVEDYVRYRPRYPASVLQVLREELALDATWVVADVGSGTGFSTELFLDNGNTVFAVEPNDEMRAAAERLLGGRPGFRSVAGSAEETALAPASVDLVAAGQAFHWFDRARAREELGRILRHPGWVALFWNARRTEESDFLREYESLLRRFGTDYEAVRHAHVDEPALGEFFAGPFVRRATPHEQVFDYAGLRGRLLSASYVPAPGHPSHEPMLEALRKIFERHQTDGQVRMPYETEIFVGKLR